MDDSCMFLRSDFYDDFADSTQRSDFWSSSARLQLTTDGNGTAQSANSRPAGVCDFLTAVTVISDAYSSGQYLIMPSLNDVHWDEVASGRDFVIGRSVLRVESTSVLDRRRTNVRHSKVIVKRMRNCRGRKRMRPADLALFIRELSILHHLHGHSNIVQLRGVGWLYDCLDDPCLTPCPKPALLVEEADCTLAWLLDHASELSFLTEMRICQDVANGLQALHTCNLLHGDVKPANVLVFPEPILVEGVAVPYYRCKISDFSIARVVDTRPCWFDWGTPLYMAPERGLMSPAGLYLTDVWSLGVLFAQVTQRHLDLKIYVGDISQIEPIVHQTVRASIQSSTWDTAASNARQAIFDHTLRKDPQNRSLDETVAALKVLFDSHDPIYSSGIHKPTLTPFVAAEERGLFISYENFKHASGQVHDAILASLRAVADDSQDPRQAQALFELAVFTLSDYAGPIYTSEEGLALLQKAALLGDVRAQGLFHRVQKYYAPSQAVSSDTLDWLQNAASVGHKIAMEDLSGLDPSRARAVTSMLTTRAYNGCVTESPFSEFVQIKSQARSVLQVANEDQNAGDLQAFQRAPSAQPSSHNLFGDTPLILASRCGDYRDTLKLLKDGADAISTNEISENFIHFAANFSPVEIRQLVCQIPVKQRQRIFLQDARGVKMDKVLDAFHLPPGTPLERAVVMNKPAVVRTILELTKTMFPPNGTIMRRAFLFALRLQFVDIQRLLLDFIHTHQDSCNRIFTELHATLWEHKGLGRTYLDAILVGGVSGFGLGADVPLKWWRICQLGDRYEGAIHESIDLLLSTCVLDRDKEMLIDRALQFMLNERYFDAVGALLTWKAVITTGNQQRVQSLKSFIWQDHQVLEQSSETINYVDQIFFDKRFGTLLHQAMWSGDRATFNLLVRRFGANLGLPAPGRKVGSLTVSQLNAYALLAHAKHCDLWFARQVRELGLDFDTPYDKCSKPISFRLPPLLHAFRRRRWPYAQWLLRHGASLEQDLGYSWAGWDVLSLCMTGPNLHLELLEFLFPQDGEGGGSAYVPARLRSGDGFQVFHFISQCHKKQTSNFHLGIPPWTNGQIDFVVIPTSREQALSLIDYQDDYSDCEGELTQGGEEEHLQWNEIRQERGGQTASKSRISDDGTSHAGAAKVAEIQLDSDRAENRRNPSLLDRCENWGAYHMESKRGRFRYIPNSQYGDGAVEEWRVTSGHGTHFESIVATVPRVAQCWRYLLDLFPDVANSHARRDVLELAVTVPIAPVRYFSTWSVPLLPVAWRWRRFSVKIPRWDRPPSLLEQSLSMGIHSYALFQVTFQHFHTRATLRPETDPFPRQTWLDLLYSSPLDGLTIPSWGRCVLATRYGYLPSIRDKFFGTSLWVVTQVLLGIGFCVTMPMWTTKIDVPDDDQVPTWVLIACAPVVVLSAMVPLALAPAMNVVYLHNNVELVQRRFMGRKGSLDFGLNLVFTVVYVIVMIALVIFVHVHYHHSG